MARVVAVCACASVLAPVCVCLVLLTSEFWLLLQVLARAAAHAGQKRQQLQDVICCKVLIMTLFVLVFRYCFFDCTVKHRAHIQ